MPDESTRPPAWARRLAAWKVPEEIADALVGDLEERWSREIFPRRGRFLANLWFTIQALSVRRWTLARTHARLRSVRPTPESSRPRNAGRNRPGSRWIMNLHDLRFALRRIGRAPGFTLVAVLSLALGIGANTAIFSVVNAVLLRGLPIQDIHEVVEVYTSDSSGALYGTSSYADLVDLRGENEVFESVVGTRTTIAQVEDQGNPRVAAVELISWDYFQTLGVPLARGRAFLPEEEVTPGTHPVAILGHRSWTRQFSADPDILGRTIRINGQPYTVVGVAPKNFHGSLSVMATTVFVPHMMTNQVIAGSDFDHIAGRGSRSLLLKARLRPGVSVEEAQAGLTAFSSGMGELYPETNENRVMTALPSGDVSLHPVVDKALVPVAGLLLVVVGLVLLISCANLASFLLARAEDRRREIAVRLALGARRGDLIRQLLVETTVLALLGGVAGAFVAGWTLDLLMAFQPPIPVPLNLEIGLDGTVLAFTAGVSLLAGLLFGLAPALQGTRPEIAPTLKSGGDRSAGPGRNRLRNGLVVTQVAFSFVLLIGAGLFVQSLQKARALDPGFYTGAAAMVWPMPEVSGYETLEEQAELMRLLEERLRAHPAIREVALADRLPLGAAIQNRGYTLPDVNSPRADGRHSIDMVTVSPEYFSVLEVPIVQGRGFDAEDQEAGGVVVVSQAFMSRYYPDRDLQDVQLIAGDNEFRVIGVAADTKVRTLGEDPRPYVYHPSDTRARMSQQFVVRGEGTSAELLAAARGVVDSVDPDLALLESKTMEEHLAFMLFPPKMAALLLSVFGGLALLLSAIGIYGTVGHHVARRTRELGIRMSLGATAGDVVRLGVGGGMRLVGIGGGVGLLLAGGLTWLISDFLLGVSSLDVGTFLLIPVLLSGVAFLAAWIPARRAARVDPVQALRSE